MTAFWEVIKNRQPVKPQEFLDEYRLYYNEDGTPREYARQEQGGQYIVVSKQVFDERRFDVRVENGKLINPNRVTQYRKLVPGDEGIETLTEDVTIIGKGQHWKVKYYD
jgi:hypothetical protein